jgi:hypothetical protein
MIKSRRGTSCRAMPTQPSRAWPRLALSGHAERGPVTPCRALPRRANSSHAGPSLGCLCRAQPSLAELSQDLPDRHN